MVDIEKIVAPISDDKPAGEDISYEPEFEALQAEIDKMSVVSSSTSEVDWKKVVSLSSKILSSKGKHILVCVYLAKALVETEGIDGFYKGTVILKEIVSNFWDSMYPPKKRKRGRINALRWWYDKIEPLVKKFTEGGEVEEEKIKGIKSALKDLDEVLDEKLGEDAPLLRPLIQLVDRIPVKVAKEEKEISEEVSESPAPESVPSSKKEAAPTPVGSPLSSSSPPAGEIESIKDLNRFLSRCTTSLGQVVQFLLREDLANPILYQVNRFCAWVDIDRLPVVQEGNKTMLPPPDESIQASIRGLMDSREYEEVVRACEGRVKEFVFWLDLSYWSAQALQELGGKYSKAYEAVSYTTFAYFERMPGLEKLSFSDGTPFVSPETKSWLNSLIGGDSVPMGGGDEVSNLLSEMEESAKKLVKEKKAADAIRVWEEGMERGYGNKMKFLCRMGLIRLLISLGKKELAIPHAMLLLEDITTHKLEGWDPILAVQGLRTVLEILDGEEDYKEVWEEIRKKFICLSPYLAFNLLS